MELSSFDLGKLTENSYNTHSIECACIMRLFDDVSEKFMQMQIIAIFY